MIASRLKRTIIATSIAMLPVVGHGATFGFQYNLKGDLLTQAFDDGKHTFLQAPRGLSIDVAYAIDEQGQKIPVPIKSQLPYIEIDGVYRQLEIQSGGKTTVVLYTGQGVRPIQEQLSNSPVTPVANSTYALVAGQPESFEKILADDRNHRAAPSQVAVPVKEYGAGKALNLDDDNHAKTQEVEGDPIPFVAGRTVLGPMGRQAVKEWAKKAGGKRLLVALVRDAGAPINQAKARGITLRKEFAKHNITNIQWLDGGEAKAGEGVHAIRVGFAPEALPRAAASVVMPRSLPSAPPQSTLIAPITNGAGDEAKFTAQIASAKQESEQGIKRITELVSMGVLNVSEFNTAKIRLEAKRDEAIRQAQLSLNQISARKVEAMAAAKAAEEARVAKTMAISQATVPGLAIKSSIVWTITEQDTSLQKLIQKWAHAANWEVMWNAPNDFAISAKASISGSLDNAINQVLASLQSTETPIVATFYEGNRVIKISTKDQN